MEPEGSLPHSQVPATCSYPEAARSSPYPQHTTSWRSILILSSHLRLQGLNNKLYKMHAIYIKIEGPRIECIW